MKVETVPAESLQVISFSLVNESNKKKENYAVPIEQVREIRNFTEITNVPKAKKHVKGVMNLRGLIIPVIDIKKRLGFGEADLLKGNYRIIIADVRDSIYGLIVDKVEQVLQISSKEIDPVPSDSFESYHYIKGIAKVQGQLIVLLDIIALLEDSEENSDEAFQKQIDVSSTSVNNSSSTHNDIPNSENNLQLDDTDEDIPDELKEVFREDEENQSTEVTT